MWKSRFWCEMLEWTDLHFQKESNILEMNFKNTKKYIKILLSLAILDVSSWLVDYCPVGSRLSIRSASIACWQPHASILSLTLQLSFAFASRRTVEVDKWNLFKHELTAGQIEFSMQVCWCCRGRVDCCCSWFSPPPFHTFHYMGAVGSVRSEQVTAIVE